MKTDIAMTNAMWSFSTRKGYRGSVFLSNSYENIADTFELSDDTYFLPGTYNSNTLQGMISTPSNKLISLRVGWTTGTYYDGYVASIGPSAITFRPSSSVNVGLDYQYDYVTVPERDQVFNSHLTRLKMDFTFTTHLSLLMFIQYSSIERFGVNNIRLRYNPREGNDLYIVFNQDYNTHLYREDPALPFNDTRTLILKYTYTFIWDR